ncbi:hypothetical protein BYT27DRAFT_7262837 [Phlegmacium glaucopus]|nr:hypothetical protein BYT27DRAFT_7262837 [Phlegmacium glaucopus]
MHRRTSYKPALYRCHFPGCKKACKTPGGLTKHQASCVANPQNQYKFSPLPPSPVHDASVDLSPSPPQTPPPNQVPLEVPPTPSQSTPQRTVWTVQGRSGIYVQKHPYLDGQPCDNEGFNLPPNAPPPPSDPSDPTDYFPFHDEDKFHIADFLFTCTQMSAGNIDILMNLWASRQEQKHEEVDPPFSNARDLHTRIDSIPLGNIAWEAFKVMYDGEVPPDSPSWMTKEYEVWYWNPLDVMEAQIGNPALSREIDYAPKRVLGRDGKRQYTDLLSGNWAWDQADAIASNPDTHGAMFSPIILGSDKTTVSVGTGQNEYYPLYALLGNVQNHVRRAHRDAVAVISFLAIPKTGRDHQDSAALQKFRHQLFHSSLTRILMPLRPWMETPRITRCGNGHYRRVIYGLGPYIADYPEQCLLACVVSGWCPRCTARSDNLDGEPEDAIQRSHEHTTALHEAFDGDLKELWEGYGIIGDIVPFTVHFPHANIHELLSPDLLHQIIKGTFKDHIVTWVVQYLESQPNGKSLVAEMDHRISVVPGFSGLQHFPDGRGFKQWTGNNSKALMKVFLPAISGLVPDAMVRAVSAFMEFCYLVRWSQIDESILVQIDAAVQRYHEERQIFITLGIHNHFDLPRQHSLLHYQSLIQMFGAPNGVCSSITESKHIKAVKQPWRRSSRNNAIGQMLLTNQRVDKLAAAHVDFEERGMLTGVQATVPTQAEVDENEDRDMEEEMSEGSVRLPKRPARGYPKTLAVLSDFLAMPQLNEYIRRFLYDQQNPDSEIFGMDVGLHNCPEISPTLHINIFHLALAIFHAPSDLSGTGGMCCEHIRCAPSWRRGPAHHDCIFIERNPDEFDDVVYPCALVHWFEMFGDEW